MPENLLSPSSGLDNSAVSLATATEADVTSGKTFYAGSKGIKTGTRPHVECIEYWKTGEFEYTFLWYEDGVPKETLVCPYTKCPIDFHGVHIEYTGRWNLSPVSDPMFSCFYVRYGIHKKGEEMFGERYGMNFGKQLIIKV